MHCLRHHARLVIGLPAEVLEQGAGRRGERHALLRRAARRIDAEHLGQPARRRHAEPCRANKGEQFEQVESGKHRHVEPPRRGPCVAQHRHLVFDPAARFGGRQSVDFAVRAEPQHFAEPGDEDRRLRHQDPPRRELPIASRHDRYDLPHLRWPKCNAVRPA